MSDNNHAFRSQGALRQGLSHGQKGVIKRPQTHGRSRPGYHKDRRATASRTEDFAGL